MKDYDEEV